MLGRGSATSGSLYRFRLVLLIVKTEMHIVYIPLHAGIPADTGCAHRKTGPTRNKKAISSETYSRRCFPEFLRLNHLANIVQEAIGSDSGARAVIHKRNVPEGTSHHQALNRSFAFYVPRKIFFKTAQIRWHEPSLSAFTLSMSVGAAIVCSHILHCT